MQYGVRNALKATVKKIRKGDIMSQVECDVTEVKTLSSVLTSDSVEAMNLKEGDQIVLLVKAVHVIPAKE